MRILSGYRAYLSNARNRFDQITHAVGLCPAAIYISEYPKSGGTWVTNLAKDIGSGPAGEAQRRLPHVIHQHWSHKDRFRPAIYVLRDGRDVVVSYYFHHLRCIRTDTVLRNRIHRYFLEILGPAYDLDDVKTNLPRFIASLRVRPHGGTLRQTRDRLFASWPSHVRDWVGREGVLVVRYEQLLDDTVSHVQRIAEHLGIGLSTEAATTIASRNSFEVMAGRQRGKEDRLSFYRKGLAGDWRNYFTKEAAHEFCRYAQDALIELGYETDNGWVNRVTSE